MQIQNFQTADTRNAIDKSAAAILNADGESSSLTAHSHSSEAVSTTLSHEQNRTPSAVTNRSPQTRHGAFLFASKSGRDCRLMRSVL